MPRLLAVLAAFVAAAAGEYFDCSDGDLGSAVKRLQEHKQTITTLDCHNGFAHAHDAGLEALAKALPPQLHQLKLYFETIHVGDAGLQALAKALPPQLHQLELDFRYTHAGDAGLEALAKALPPQLHQLKLYFDSTHVGDAGLEALAKALPSGLRQLKLVFWLTSVGDAGLEALAKALPSGLRQLELDFRYTHAGDAGLEALAKALPSGLRQLELDFRHTSVSDAALVSLPFSMLRQRTFKSLSIHVPNRDIVMDGPLDSGAKLVYWAKHVDMSDPGECDAVFSTSGIDLLHRDAQYRTPKMYADANGAENLSNCLASLGGDYAPLRDMHTWCALALAALAASIYAVAFTGGGGASLDAPASSGFQKGEHLLAARALSSKGCLKKAGPLFGKLRRSFQACARFVFVAGPVAYVWSPRDAWCLVFTLYLPPAVWSHGFRTIARSPYLAFFTSWAWLQSLLSFAFFLIGLDAGALTMTRDTYDNAGGLHGGLDQLSNGLITLISNSSSVRRQTNDRVTRLIWDSAYWPHDEFHAPIVNRDLASMDLYLVFVGFIIVVTICFVLVDALGQIAALPVRLVRALLNRASSTLDAGEVRRLAQQIREQKEKGTLLDQPPEGVEPVCGGPTSPFSPGLYVSLFFLLLDSLWFDVNSIFIMLNAGHYAFAGCLSAIFLTTIFSDVAQGNLKALPGDIKETLRTGVCTPRLLEVMDRERGFEAFLSLGITTYAIPYAFTTANSMVFGLMSMCLSLWGLGTHVYEALDLGIHEASIGAQPGEGNPDEEAAALPLTQE